MKKVTDEDLMTFDLVEYWRNMPQFSVITKFSGLSRAYSGPSITLRE